jgi:hypothetical protein
VLEQWAYLTEATVKNTMIIIDERSSVVMMKREQVVSSRVTPRREVIAPMATVLTNLKDAGYTTLYLANDHTIVVGVSEAAVNHETLDVVYAKALGPAPTLRHSSVAGLDGYRNGRKS